MLVWVLTFSKPMAVQQPQLWRPVTHLEVYKQLPTGLTARPGDCCYVNGQPLFLRKNEGPELPVASASGKGVTVSGISTQGIFAWDLSNDRNPNRPC